MNQANKQQAIIIIDDYKINHEDYPAIVNDIELDINSLSDDECKFKNFLNNIWEKYAEKMPQELLWSLLYYTDYYNAKIEWSKSVNPKAIMMSNIKYKINLPNEQLQDLRVHCENGYLIDTFDIPVIFDINTKKWHIIEDDVYGQNQIYPINLAKEICLRQYNINKAKEEKDILLKKAKEESKKLEKEEAKRQKQLEKAKKKEQQKEERQKKLKSNKNIEPSLF